jgi:aminopeptidase-like protein
LDDLNLVTPSGLKGGFKALKKTLDVIEKNVYPKIEVLGEPQLGKRGFSPTVSTKKIKEEFLIIRHLLSYCDGQKSVIEIANLLDEPFWALWPIVEKLVDNGLLSVKTISGES